jgi:hypothetical protein
VIGDAGDQWEVLKEVVVDGDPIEEFNKILTLRDSTDPKDLKIYRDKVKEVSVGYNKD